MMNPYVEILCPYCRKSVRMDGSEINANRPVQCPRCRTRFSLDTGVLRTPPGDMPTMSLRLRKQDCHLAATDK